MIRKLWKRSTPAPDPDLLAERMAEVAARPDSTTTAPEANTDAPLQADPDAPAPSQATSMLTLDSLGQTMVATVIESDLNGDKVGELAFQLADCITTRPGTRNLVIDLQNVEYLDSACLNQLVDLFSRIKEAGGQVGIARTTNQIQDLFKLTRLDRLFPVHRTVIDAISALEKAG